MSSQIVMTYPNKRPASSLPYAFILQGEAMLSGILDNTKTAQRKWDKRQRIGFNQ